MKKEYKRFLNLVYCYDPVTDTTVRLDTEAFDIMTFGYRLSDWDKRDGYTKCTKKAFKTALNAAIKKLIEVTK